MRFPIDETELPWLDLVVEEIDNDDSGWVPLLNERTMETPPSRLLSNPIYAISRGKVQSET